MLMLAVLGTFAAIAVIIYTLLEGAEEKAVIRASLRQLQEYEVENVRDQELLTPFMERAVRPLVQGVTRLGQRFTPVGYVEATRKKLTLAGMTETDTLDRFLAIRVVSIALVPVWAVLVFGGVLPLEGRAALGVFALLAMVSVLGPDAVVNRRMADRQKLIRNTLPDILDLLTISVEAGLGFEQALDRTVTSVPGPLSDEFQRVLGEVRAGATRADAMRALDERTDVYEVRSFVLSILQADTFGVSISRILRVQADEMRIKRRQLAQEEAQKAPVKMLIPMVFCIFPALFVVVIGPAALNIADTFK